MSLDYESLGTFFIVDDRGFLQLAHQSWFEKSVPRLRRTSSQTYCGRHNAAEAVRYQHAARVAQRSCQPIHPVMVLTILLSKEAVEAVQSLSSGSVALN